MDRLFSGLLNTVRRAAAKPTSNGTTAEPSSSSSKNTPKLPTYSSWKTDAEAKIEAVNKIVSPLLQRQERLYEFQTQLKKLNTSLNEIDALLTVDNYEDGRKDMKDNAAFIDLLLEFWYKLILLLDKVDMDHGVHYLNSIYKVVIRPEFDLMTIPAVTLQGGDFLKIAPEQLVVMRRYLTLLFNTHTHVAVKLSETSPIGANSPIVRFQNLHTAYARLLSAAYFRLPSVAELIIGSCSLDQSTIDKLWDFSILIPQAANSMFTGAELVASPVTAAAKDYRSPGNPKMARSASASGQLQKPQSLPSLSPPRQRVVVPAAPPTTAAAAATPAASGAAAPSPLLSRVRRDFAAPTGVSSIEQDFTFIEKEPLSSSSATTNSTQQAPNVQKIGSMQVASSEEIADMERKLLEQRKQLLQKEAELTAMLDKNSGQSSSSAVAVMTEIDEPDSNEKTTTVITVVSSVPASVPTSPQPVKANPKPPYAISAPTSVIDIPPLFSWCKLHATLIRSDHSRLSGSWNEAPRRKWLPWFNRGESALFIIFLREWISHVQAMVDRMRRTRKQMRMSDPTTEFRFSLVTGYDQLVKAFLFNFRQYDRPSKLLMDTTKALLACDPSLINFFVKHVYSRTNLYNMDLVNNLFVKLDLWFNEFDRLEKTLPPDFDATFFCSGLELLMDLDHHQLTSRILAFIFTNSSLLMGNVRRVILYDFLLKKFFFRLFLHWDDVVRNYFHQLLIYRMVRIPRSHLAEAGFHAPEIAVLGSSPSSSGSLRAAQLSSEEDLLDMKLFTNISAYVRTVEDQLRAPDRGDPTFDKALEIYAPKALAEYRYYLSRYEENESTPKLVPMHMLQERKLPPGVKAQPTRVGPKTSSEDAPS